MLGNLFFLFASAAFTIGAGLVFSGKFMPLKYDEATKAAVAVLMVSVFVLICTFSGCCGAIHQVKRSGLCAGRRVLSSYQVMLLFLLLYSIKQCITLKNREKSIDMVLSDPSRFPRYDKFEADISRHFDSAYFEGICTERPYESWVVEWLNKKCPETMRQQKCYLNGRKRYICDTTCDYAPWRPDMCCPSRELCDANVPESCPYYQCRFAVLTEIRWWMRPFTVGIQFVAWLAGIMIMLTCLLICYNPRDDLEHELIKTGVMTEDDIEQIKESRRKGQEKQSLIGHRGSNRTSIVSRASDMSLPQGGSRRSSVKSCASKTPSRRWSADSMFSNQRVSRARVSPVTTPPNV